MTSYFFDSSALVKRYVLETGSAWVNSLVLSGAACYIARLTRAEVSAAIVRRAPLPGPTAWNPPELLARFDADCAAVYLLLSITDAATEDAAQLARMHRLRGGDAVQLAVAVAAARRIDGLVFISADSALNAAAQTAGLRVADPNAH